MEKVKWHKESVARSFTVISAIVFALAIYGCAGASDDTPGADAGPDGPPIAAPALELWLEGAESGAEIRVATDDTNFLCFNARPGRDVKIKKLRVEIASPQGLTYGDVAQYSDIKVMTLGRVVAGPASVALGMPDTNRSFVFETAFTIVADQTQLLCVDIDVANENALSGNELDVTVQPFELGDVLYDADGSTVPLDQIVWRGPIATRATIKGITGATIPKSRPSVSEEPLPTTGLTLGDFVAYKMSIEAPPGGSVLIKEMSFRVHVFPTTAADATILDHARLGLDGQLDLSGTWDIETGGGDCNFVASSSLRCVRVFLNTPVRIPAGTAAKVELRMNVSGTLTSGELVTTSAVMDVFGPQEGPLTMNRIDSLFPNNVEWSNDGLWWYNGYSVHWGTPFSQALGYH